MLSAAMEPKHKELLAQCHQSLAQAMTEVDKVIELLEAAGTLTPLDLQELQEAGVRTGGEGDDGGGGGDAGGGGRLERPPATLCKADMLIKLLLAKDQDHFQDLRVALEKTQPHLLSILYLNNGVAGTQPGETVGEWMMLRSFAGGGGGAAGGDWACESCFIATLASWVLVSISASQSLVQDNLGEAMTENHLLSYMGEIEVRH